MSKKYDTSQRVYNKKINFWLDRKTLKKLDAEAKKRRESRSLVLRDILREYLGTK